MNEPQACPDCLRRAWLLARLAPHIEQWVSGAPDRRAPDLLSLGNEELAGAVAPRADAQVLAQVEALPECRLRADLAAAQCWGCCRHDDHFPPGLRAAADGPWALIGRGDPALLSRLIPSSSVAVVGSRRASTYGREVARELARDLAREGVVVVSGFAFGIDACAHRGALEAGLTAAVLGCGADTAYPAAHRSLWRQIGEQGLVISELAPGSGAWRWTLLARNRILAGLCGMTVVVEAAQRSGSLATAHLAVNLGRCVGAIPGPVNSRLAAGPNDLLAAGACLIREARDVLEALALPGGVEGDADVGPTGQRG